MLMQDAIKNFSTRNSREALAQLVPQLRDNGGQDLHSALLIMKMFEQTHPELQSELGDCYYIGDGVASNPEQALALFQAAASRGSVRSQYDLGWYYYDRGEFLRSIDHFSFCISHQNELDDDKIGKCYGCLGDAYSRISEPKISTAIDNLAISAEKYHNGFACRRLGILYSEVGTHHFDPEKSVRYFELGASVGDITSAHNLAINYILGDENLRIPRDGRKAEKLLLPFSDVDDAAILGDLGLLYQRGDPDNGINKDYNKSKMYYERSWKLNQSAYIASDLGYVYYCLNEYQNAEKMFHFADEAGYTQFSDFLGRLYKEGLLGEKNLHKAAFFYGRAYESGNLNNIFTYGEYAEMLEELGDYQKAYDVADQGEAKFKDIWFVFIKANLVLNGKVTNRISADHAAEMLDTCTHFDGYKEKAYMTLGQYYLSAKEYRKAEKNYTDAFTSGLADAGVYLGRLYESGGGTIKSDIGKAFDWYSKAADAGSDTGKEEVACFKKGLLGGYKRVRSL